MRAHGLFAALARVGSDLNCAVGRPASLRHHLLALGPRGVARAWAAMMALEPGTDQRLRLAVVGMRGSTIRLRAHDRGNVLPAPRGQHQIKRIVRGHLARSA